jgi:hypothetical protein
MQLFKQLAKLCLTLAISYGCANMEIANIGPMVTLPASGDCFQVEVLTLKETRYPKAKCDEIKKRGIIMTSEDWKKQKVSIQKNCQLQKCKQLVGVFDSLFLTIDEALKKVP